MGMAGYIKAMKYIQAGYLYFSVGKGTYMVCIGKQLCDDEHRFVFVEFCETMPSTSRVPFNRLTTRLIRICEIDYTEFGYAKLEYVDKLIEPTEEAIRAWRVQLKLIGYKVSEDSFKNNLYYFGDWRTRKKLSCVNKFEVGKRYVEEELAYLRTQMPYQRYDVIWEYLGENGGGWNWSKIVIDGISGTELLSHCWRRARFDPAPHKEMVLFKPTKEGYQGR